MDAIDLDDDDRPTLPTELTLAAATGRPAPLRVDTFADAFFGAGPAAAVRVSEIEARAAAKARREAIARGVLAILAACVGLVVAAFAA